MTADFVEQVTTTDTCEQESQTEQSWREVCPHCHIHRGHRANCPNAHTVAETPEDLSLAAYREFLKQKVRPAEEFGFAVELDEIHPWLKPHARVAVQWAVRGGRRALFEAFGLMKTVQQLEIVRLVLKRVGGRGLIVIPLGVRQEFEKDAAKLGITVKFNRVIEQMSNPGDVVLDPFSGLATVAKCAVEQGRRALATELCEGYFEDGCGYVQAAEDGLNAPTLFDLLEAEEPDLEIEEAIA